MNICTVANIVAKTREDDDTSTQVAQNGMELLIVSLMEQSDTKSKAS